MGSRKRLPAGTEDDPRVSWRHISATRYYQGVLRVGDKIIWACNHVHPSPNGYGTTLTLSDSIKWSALDCAEQERKRRADAKATASFETVGGT